MHTFGKRPLILTKKNAKGRNWIFLIPLLIITSIVTLLPGIDAIRASFGSSLEPGLSLENYRVLFRDRAIFYSLNITVLWATCNSFLSVSIGLLLAHHMILDKGNILSRLIRKFRKQSKRRVPSRPLLYGFLLIPLGIPIYIAVPLWRAFLHGDGGLSVFSRLTGITLNLLTNPFAAFIGALIVSVWINIPLTTFVIYSHLRQVNHEILDCARLETKSQFLLMRYIQFPIIRTSVFTMLALNFVKAFKEFTLIHLMTGGGVPLVSGITERFMVGSTTTLGVFLYNVFTGFNDYGFTAAFAVVMASLVAIVLIFWMLSTISDIEKRNTRFKQVLLVVLMIDFFADLFLAGGSFSILKALIYSLFFLSLTKHIFFSVGTVFAIIHTTVGILLHGFLEGFSPVLPAILFTYFLTLPPSCTNLIVPPKSMKTLYKYKETSTLDKIIDWSYQGAIYICTILFIISSVVIIAFLILLSISGLNACYFNNFIPKYFSVAAFVKLFTTEHIMKYFLNTAIIAIGAAIMTPLVVIPAAWSLSTIKKERANSFVSFIHVLGTLGGMHSLVPLFMIFILLGLINTFQGLILVYTVHAIPFALVTIKNFFEGKPRELREPALLEGATTLQYLRWILLPLSKPIIKTAMILAFLGAWNGFTAPLLFLTEESMYPVSLKLYTYVGSVASGNPQWNLFAAAAVINLVIIRLLGGRRLSRDTD